MLKMIVVFFVLAQSCSSFRQYEAREISENAGRSEQIQNSMRDDRLRHRTEIDGPDFWKQTSHDPDIYVEVIDNR